MSIIRLAKDSKIYITLPHLGRENIISFLRDSHDPFEFYSRASCSRFYFEADQDYESRDLRTHEFILKEDIICSVGNDRPSNMAEFTDRGVNGYSVTLFREYDFNKLRLVKSTREKQKTASFKRKRTRRKNNGIILNI